MTKHPVDETLPKVVMPSCPVHKTGASSGIGKGVALALSKAGADVVVNYASSPEQAEEVVAEIRHEGVLRVLRPGGTLSSLGVYSGDLTIPLDAFTAGIGDHTIVTTLCLGGKERMRRLMEVIASGRLDTRPLVTHRFELDKIEEDYDLFANQRDGVLKVAVTP